MRISQIEYENFRNFKEHGKVECSTDGKVTIIYGVNGAGKTTFHQLFQWIIYGETHFNKTASDKMFNLDYERNLPVNKQFSVLGIIDFEHAGEQYSMRREWIYKKGMFDSQRLSATFTISKKDDDNNWIRMQNPTDLIEQLLPSGLAEYFFFDGESMIADLKAKGKDSANSLKEALYLMLDLNIYAKAVEYIGKDDLKTTVLGTLFLSKTGFGSSAELKTLGLKMDSAQTARDEQQQREEKYSHDISELQEKIQKISEQIGGAKSQREYEAKRQECKQRRDEYLKMANREYALFGEELISVFPKQLMSKVIERASRKLKAQAQESKLIHGVNKELIDALLQEDKCICGTTLTEVEKEHLRELYKFLPPLGYDSLYLNFTDMAKRWGKEYDRNKIDVYIENAVSDLVSASKMDDEIVNIDKQMEQDRQYENLVIQRRKAEQEIESLNRNRDACRDELKKAKLLVNKLQKEITKLSSSVETNKIIDRKIEIMEEVKKYFQDILQEKSEVYSKKLETTIQDLLDKMMEAKRNVTVGTDFSLKVADSFDDESKSEGQFATVSFAYIGGIFKLLSEETILKNKEYPLVLDAPFSKLGKGPRQKVIDTIPNYAPQIILLSKDNLQDSFAPEQIGKVYTIESNSEQNIAEIKEGFLWK